MKEQEFRELAAECRRNTSDLAHKLNKMGSPDHPFFIFYTRHKTTGEIEAHEFDPPERVINVFTAHAEHFGVPAESLAFRVFVKKREEFMREGFLTNEDGTNFSQHLDIVAVGVAAGGKMKRLDLEGNVTSETRDVLIFCLEDEHYNHASFTWSLGEADLPKEEYAEVIIDGPQLSGKLQNFFNLPKRGTEEDFAAHATLATSKDEPEETRH